MIDFDADGFQEAQAGLVHLLDLSGGEEAHAEALSYRLHAQSLLSREADHLLGGGPARRL